MTEAILDTETDAPAPAEGELVEGPGKQVTDALNEQAAASDNKAFLESFPPTLRDTPTLKNVRNTEDLATQFINQQSLLGNSLRIPTEDTGEDKKREFYEKLTEVPGVVKLPGDNADDSEKREFLSKLGVPNTPQEYNIKLEEGQELDDEFLKSGRERAHELGLTNEQLNKVIQQEIKDREALAFAHNQAVEQTTVQLKSMWGADYDTRVAGASSAFRVLSQEMPEAAKELQSVANNAMFIKMLSDIGETLQEKGHAGMQAAGNYGMSVNDAKMKKEEIMENPDHPYHQGADEAVQYMLKLHEIIASGNQ